MALGGQMQVDHGRVQTSMSQVLLDATDVDPGLEQVGGIAVTQGVDGDTFFEFDLFKDPS